MEILIQSRPNHVVGGRREREREVGGARIIGGEKILAVTCQFHNIYLEKRRRKRKHTKNSISALSSPNKTAKESKESWKIPSAILEGNQRSIENPDRIVLDSQN